MSAARSVSVKRGETWVSGELMGCGKPPRIRLAFTVAGRQIDLYDADPRVVWELVESLEQVLDGLGVYSPALEEVRS